MRGPQASREIGALRPREKGRRHREEDSFLLAEVIFRLHSENIEAKEGHPPPHRRLMVKDLELFDESEMIIAQDRRGTPLPSEQPLANGIQNEVLAALVASQGFGKGLERATDRGVVPVVSCSGESSRELQAEEGMLRDKDVEWIGPRPRFGDRVRSAGASPSVMGLGHGRASGKKDDDPVASRCRSGGIGRVVRIEITCPG